MDKTSVSTGNTNTNTNTNENENENTFWNYFLIVVIIIIIWYVFFKNKEGFAGLFQSSNPLPKLSNVPKELMQENKDKAMKIIQKINKIDKALGDSQNILQQNVKQYDDYQHLSSNPISQYGMAPLDLSSVQDQNIDQVHDLNQVDNSDQDLMYPNLRQSRPFSSIDQRVNFNDKLSNVNKTADGSTRLMNQVGLLDGKPVSCNMLGVNTADMDEYKRKFYSMYSHQIECPSKCGLKANGMSKGCGMGSKCGLGSGCSNVNSDTSNPDTFALNYLALDNANKKSCVTCNFKPTKNPLNREWMERDYPSYDGLPEDVRIADEARLKKMNLIDANVSNYVNFENNVYQDSNGGESAPDRINEIRTCQDANGTCSLKDYGTSIANVYDKLIATPSFTSRNSCNPYQLTGILEDAAPTDMYASIH
jgi:hypothetical protein